MHPGDCPEWEYNTHPRCDKILSREAFKILIELRSGSLNTLELPADTRPIHLRLFNALVPVGYDYYAGHYRGETYRCLQFYTVGIQGDRRVGYPPEVVPIRMKEIAKQVRDSLKILNEANAIPNSQLPAEQKLQYIVAFACHTLELFFRIHPYANGNGHAGRFMVWSILGRYGYWPKKWPLHPRPPDPPYTTLIERYRNGDWEPLEIFMMKNILGT